MKLTVTDEALTTAFRDLWDDATNAVCQTLQERGMCGCIDGECIASTVGVSAIDLTNARRAALQEVHE